MAKIYETSDDYQRDKLADQAKDMRLKAEKQATNGLALIGLSFAPAVFKLPSWLHTVASVTGLIGMFDVVRSWMTGHRAHDLELERERMGPQHVVLLEQPKPEAAHAHGECHACRHSKSHSHLESVSARPAATLPPQR